MSETPHAPIIGIVLAGGLAKRMGGEDKPFIRLGGKTMLERTIERLSPQVDRLVINANGDPERFATFGLPVVPDAIEGFAGPLAGLHAGMRWAEKNEPEARFVVTAASDTPFFPASLVQGFEAGGGMAEDTVMLAASPAGTHSVFGRWPVAFAGDLEAYLNAGESGKILAFADRYIRLNVPFEEIVLAGGETVDPFFNVNTPEDAARAEEIAAALEGHAA